MLSFFRFQTALPPAAAFAPIVENLTGRGRSFSANMNDRIMLF